MKNLTINGNLPTILPAGYLKDRMNTIRTKGLPKGFYTGVSNLDDVFRLDKGRLITITGVPNCGKSEFVDFLITTYTARKLSASRLRISHVNCILASLFQSLPTSLLKNFHKQK